MVVRANLEGDKGGAMFHHVTGSVASLGGRASEAVVLGIEMTGPFLDVTVPLNI